MNRVLRAAFDAEIELAASATEHEKAMHHLARAHILSQRHTRLHVWTHWLMLKAGARAGDAREVAGQMARIFAAAVFSRIWVPVGNTGRADVSALKPMPIPEDLRPLLEAER